MSERGTRETDAGRFAFILANGAVAEKGNMACLDTADGTVKPGAASTTLIPVGYFAENKTGDGTATVIVRLFREVKLHWFANDTAPNAVTTAMVGSEVYVKNSYTVTASSSGNSKAGRVWAVTTADGVLVELGAAVTGPTGASGSALTSGGVADRTALAAVAAASRFDGELVMVRSDGSLWRFVASPAGTYAASDEAQELVIVPAAGTGVWLRADKSITLRLPIAFGTADAAALITIPEKFVLKLTAHPYYHVTTAFTGGTSSAIGASTAKAGYNTKGDLQGGTGGDLTAALGAGIKLGTAGAKLATIANFQALVLVEGDIVRFDRIASVYTAGAGFLCFPVSVNSEGPLTP